MTLDRTEALRREWRERLAKVLEPMLPPPPLEDPLVKYADPGPPQDVRLPGWKRHLFVLRRR